MDPDIEEEISEIEVNPYQRNIIEEMQVQEPPKETRGRKKLPELWTRVISLSSDRLDNVRTFSIATDLLMAAGY